ncbi:hypothetical protein [Roseateles chitosanitabidus]|uniref:hypothetical protein n=1 Tax=Roseateles chitosanitabidus TaxID=65048 RepID=UPI0008301131|nr:hypothetical protein [Roseateles chitosanitabidus]
MAFTNSNDFITGRKPVPTPAGIELVTQRFPIDMLVADLAVNTIGQFGILPAGCIPVEIRVDGDDVDSGAGAGVYQVGIWDGASANLSAAAADGGGAWGDTGAAVAVAFDKHLVRTGNNLAKVQPSAVDRRIGLKVTAAPTTPVAGQLGITVTYRAA